MYFFILFYYEILLFKVVYLSNKKSIRLFGEILIEF